MPFTSRAKAKDAILTEVRKVVDALLDERAIEKAIWDAKPESRPSEATKTWIRVTLTHVPGSAQVGSLNGCPESGSRRYNRTASLGIQIFEPSGNGREVGDAIGERFENALQGKLDAEALVFRNVGTTEAGTDGPWDQTNTTATVLYDVFA